jgi:hypothetical protein
MAVGLLLLSGVNLINQFAPVPHFIRGFFVGFGFVMVLAGFIGFVKQKRRTAS